METQWFKNNADGVVGAVKLDPGTGRPEAVAIGPGETVELTEEEQRRTASAPRDALNNPLAHGGANDGPALVPVDLGYERPLRGAPAEEHAADAGPQAPVEGQRSALEEVGVPPV